MELYVYVICLIFASAAALASKQYREDYEYDSETKAFYKLHTKKNMKEKHARDVCITEGAKLIMPETIEELVKIRAMLNSFPDVGDLWVDNDERQYPSVTELDDQELTACNVVSREALIKKSPCTRKLPFICKVEHTDTWFDFECGVYASGYQYLPSVGSCYKVAPFPYPWNAAYEECRAEGAHLVVLNSKSELQDVSMLLRPIESNFHSFYVGIRANRLADGSGRVFRTIFNETLEEAGYNGWARGQPDNYNNSQDCVVVSRFYGTYNDVNCDGWYRFICEKEVYIRTLREAPSP